MSQELESPYERKYYRFSTDEDTDESVLVMEQRVDLSTVDISQDSDGFLTVTEKCQPSVRTSDPLKYELRPEGNLYRIYALVDMSFPYVRVGQPGGLVSHKGNLSQSGTCWISQDSQVTGNASIQGHAQVTHGSDVLGETTVTGHASLYRTVVKGNVTMEGNVRVERSLVETDDHSNIHLTGRSTFMDSTIEARRGEYLTFMGGCVTGAHIRNRYELMSVQAQPHGWLDVFRARDGRQCFSIGCQMVWDAAGLRDLAQRFETDEVQRAMLEHFIALADAARQGWLPEPSVPTTTPQNLDEDTSRRLPME